MRAASLFGIILLSWVIASFVFIHLFVAGKLLPSNDYPNLGLHLAGSSKNDFSPAVEGLSGYRVDVLGQAVGTDSRAAIVDKFLAKYSSPMYGSGRAFVTSADKFGIDWRLLPGIAFQESSLGKKIPTGSYNPFGWGVYQGKVKGASFRSWDHAIEVVAGGIRTDYFNRGYDNVEELASRYTSGQSASAWIFAVSQAMEELSESTL
jgi:hypothetical protein